MNRIFKDDKFVHILFPISAILNFLLSFISPYDDYGNGMFSYGFPSPFLYYRSREFYYTLNSDTPFSFNIDLLQLIINILITYIFVRIVYKCLNAGFTIIKGYLNTPNQ